MSAPNKKFVTITDIDSKIIKLIDELVLEPRINAIEWSKITKQTPNIKIGYPGQHLASLITGMTGERTGARGNDLIDGSEVKSCSRIDQLDTCKDCGLSVSRIEEVCPHCDSSNIDRKNDSKWLITIRNEDDLDVLLNQVRRVLLMIGDYPNFADGDFETLRFQAFEIWPDDPRHSRFGEIMTNYYRKIYLKHRKKNPDKTPAPKNFWPYSYQFYICNPVLVFSCTVTNASTEPKISIDHLVSPVADRAKIESVSMPSSVLNDAEIILFARKTKLNELNKIATSKIKPGEVKKLSAKKLKELIPYIPEKFRSVLELRDTDKISVARKKYARRKNG